MPVGEWLTRWTIRVALVLYGLAVAGELLRPQAARVAPRARPPSGRAASASRLPSRLVAWAACLPLREQGARWIWTLGCGFYLAHVAAAFHFYHGWSHRAAYVDTARQTAEVTGINWGGGLYFNYAFTLLWLADTLWWWLAPASRRTRPMFVTATLHGFFAFMVFNATVVFATGPLRWVALAAFGVVGILGLLAARKKPQRTRVH